MTVLVLRSARETAGVDLEEMAARVGVDVGTYRAFETGQETPSWPQLVSAAVCDAEDVDRLMMIDVPINPRLATAGQLLEQFSRSVSDRLFELAFERGGGQGKDLEHISEQNLSKLVSEFGFASRLLEGREVWEGRNGNFGPQRLLDILELHLPLHDEAVLRDLHRLGYSPAWLALVAQHVGVVDAALDASPHCQASRRFDQLTDAPWDPGWLDDWYQPIRLWAATHPAADPMLVRGSIMREPALVREVLFRSNDQDQISALLPFVAPAAWAGIVSNDRVTAEQVDLVVEEAVSLLGRPAPGEARLTARQLLELLLFSRWEKLTPRSLARIANDLDDDQLRFRARVFLD